jgi:mannose-6-phosphate isomerase-like protein (cupin superfamily)
MSLEKINLAEKFSRISEHWSPKIAGEINDSYVKLVKVKGEFVWHHHENEDELFLVTKGRLQLRFRDREVWLGPGEFFIVPRGVEHMPVAQEETHVVLLEPKSTLNTGNVQNERTLPQLERI